MTDKISKKDIHLYLFILLITIFLCLYENITIGLIFSFILFGLIWNKAKISFFTEISFILIFSFFQTWVQSQFHNAYGMIQNAKAGVPLYAEEHLTCTLSFLVTLLFFVTFTNLIKNEKELYQKRINLSLVTCLVLITIAVVLVFLLFPSIPNFKIGDDRRTQGISAMYGFALTALLLTGITFDMSYRYKFLWLFYGIIIFWFLGHAERVEILGLISYFFLKGFNREKLEKMNLKKYAKRVILIILLFAFLLLLIWIGLYRDSRISAVYEGKFSLILLLKKLFVQGTAGDVVYVFDCAVDLWKNGKILKGITYLDWLLQLIPGADIKYNAAIMIKRYYFTMGGALLFTEPMMNFGMIGVFATNIIFCVGYYLITKKSSLFRCMFWIPIVIEVFRICWYGRDGWILASFVEVPLLYLIIILFLNKLVLVNKKKEIIG